MVVANKTRLEAPQNNVNARSEIDVLEDAAVGPIVQPVDVANVFVDASDFRCIRRGPPAGQGTWEFQLGGLGGQVFRFEGDYTSAARAARRAAADAGFANVYLCP